MEEQKEGPEVTNFGDCMEEPIHICGVSRHWQILARKELQ